MGSIEKTVTPSGPTAHALANGTARAEKADETKALKAFDAYFLGEMLRQSKPKNSEGLFDGGQAGRMYQDHLYQEMAKLIAEKGDFGLAGSLMGSLDRASGSDVDSDMETAPSDPQASEKQASQSEREEGS